MRAGRSSTRSPTFRVGTHYYALVHATGLTPGVSHEYEVRLDGEVVWPEPSSPFPPSVVRVPGEGELVKLVFGSCRISAPHEPPFTLSHADDERGLGVDAYAMAMRLRDQPPEELPHALVLLGTRSTPTSPRTTPWTSSARGATRAALLARMSRTSRRPGSTGTRGDPAIQWLLSTVPFNGLRRPRGLGRLEHLRVLGRGDAYPPMVERPDRRRERLLLDLPASATSPKELAANELFEKVRTADDAWPLLREFASHAHRTSEGTRWSCRTSGTCA